MKGYIKHDEVSSFEYRSISNSFSNPKNAKPKLLFETEEHLEPDKAPEKVDPP